MGHGNRGQVFRPGGVVMALMAALLLQGLLVAQAPQTAERQLRAAMYRAEVQGDWQGAIAEFARLAKDKDRSIAARSLLALGDAYEKTGAGDPRAVFTQVVNEFGDQKEAATFATRRLAALQRTTASRAGSSDLFPSRTLDFRQGLNGRLSPDGKLMMIRRPGNAEPDWFIQELDSGREHLVIRKNGLIQRTAAFSPDGSRIAAFYTSDCGHYGQPNYRGELVVASVAEGAGPPIVLPHATDPFHDPVQPCTRIYPEPAHARVAWSPDSRFLPFLAAVHDSRRGDVRLLTAATGESRSLGIEVEGEPEYQWSPDGAQLAVHVTNAAKKTDEVALVTVATWQTRRVPLPTTPGRVAILGKWTSRGHMVLRVVADVPGRTSRTMDMGLLDLTTGRFTITCTGRIDYISSEDFDVCVDVTPDGSSQLVWKRSAQLIVRDTGTLTERPLTRASGEEFRGFLSPDGQLVVFVSNRDGRWGLYVAPTAQAPVTRPVLVAKLDNLPGQFWPTWTTTGLAVAIRTIKSDIYRVAVNRETGRTIGELERLTQDRPGNWFAVPSPSGSRIAYFTQQNAKWANVAVMDADGSNEQIVSEDPSYAWYAPVWRSEDELLIVRDNPNGVPARRSLVSFKLATREVREITALPAVAQSLWDLDQFRSELVYVNAADLAGSLVVRARSLADGTERTMVTVDGVTGRLLTIRVSPDGRKIAYLMNRGTGAQTGRELGVIDVETGTARQLAQPGFSQVLMAWSPDSRYLLFGELQPWILDTSNRSRWPAIDEKTQRIPDGIDWSPDGTSWFTPFGRWAPDGSYLALSLSGVRESFTIWQGLTYDAVMKAMAQAGSAGR